MNTGAEVSDTGESKRYDDLARKFSTLSKAVKKIVDINIEHTHAAKDLGAGKKGGSPKGHYTRKHSARR